MEKESKLGRTEKERFNADRRELTAGDEAGRSMPQIRTEKKTGSKDKKEEKQPPKARQKSKARKQKKRGYERSVSASARRNMRSCAS